MRTRHCSILLILFFFIGLLIHESSLVRVHAAEVDSPLKNPKDSPILLQRIRDLSFGQIISSDMSGTITVHPITGRTINTVNVVPASLYSPAIFTVYGQPNTNYHLTLPSSVTLHAGNRSMLLTNFVGVADSAPQSPPPDPRLDQNGADTVRIGATLHVASRQGAGVYEGSFSIIVAYD